MHARTCMLRAKNTGVHVCAFVVRAHAHAYAYMCVCVWMCAYKLGRRGQPYRIPSAGLRGKAGAGWGGVGSGGAEEASERRRQGGGGRGRRSAPQPCWRRDSRRARSAVTHSEPPMKVAHQQQRHQRPRSMRKLPLGESSSMIDRVMRHSGTSRPEQGNDLVLLHPFGRRLFRHSMVCSLLPTPRAKRHVTDDMSKGLTQTYLSLASCTAGSASEIARPQPQSVVHLQSNTALAALGFGLAAPTMVVAWATWQLLSW